MWRVGVREGAPPLWSRLGILIQSWSPRPDLLQSHKYKHKCNNKYKHKCNNKYKQIFKWECKSLHKQRRPWPEPASTKNKTDHFFSDSCMRQKIWQLIFTHFLFPNLFLVLHSFVVMRQSFGSSKISFILLASGRCHLFPPKGTLVVATPLFSFSKSGDD